MLFTYALAAVLSLASATNFGSGDAQPFCRLEGTFTATTPVGALTTFNAGSVADAGLALCNALTASSLGATSSDCGVANNNIVALVAAGGTRYECRAVLTNTNVCKKTGNTGSDSSESTEGTEGTDDDRKRNLLPNLNPCNSYRDYNECVPPTCSTNALGQCPCLWDNPEDVNGFPADAGTPCPEGKICCHNPPCSTWTDELACEEGSRTLVVTPTFPDGEPNCEFLIGADPPCRCRAPLVNETEPIVGSFSPYDCACPNGAVNATATQCSQNLTPTQQQLRQIRRFNQRIGRISAQLSRRAFVKACKTSVTKVTAKGNDKKALVAAANKYSSELRKSNVAFFLEYVKEGSKNVAKFTTYPDDAKRAKSVADTTFTPEDYDSLEILDVDANTAASASTLVVSIAAASIAATVNM